LRVVRRFRVTTAQRETSPDGYFFGEMCGLRQRGRVGGWGELSGQADAFGMSGAIAGMLAEQAIQGIDQISWRGLLSNARNVTCAQT
jgi:hypothetical protein